MSRVLVQPQWPSNFAISFALFTGVLICISPARPTEDATTFGASVSALSVAVLSLLSCSIRDDDDVGEDEDDDDEGATILKSSLSFAEAKGSDLSVSLVSLEGPGISLSALESFEATALLDDSEEAELFEEPAVLFEELVFEEPALFEEAVLLGGALEIDTTPSPVNLVMRASI